jgi:alpha-tubulin suppressor-like RCC1 family protein
MIHDPPPNISTIPFPSPTSLWVWGADTEGELGDNASVDKLQPHPNNVFFPAGTVLTSLTAGNGDPQVGGGSHSLAMDRNRNLWAWGHNVFGQVGNGRGGIDVFGPVQVCGAGQTTPCTQFLGNVIATAAGELHSLGLDSFGNVWAWGNNDLGQLGSDLGSGVRAASVPVRNTALFAQVDQHGRPPITAIAAGSNHSLALDSAGLVWAWGSNDFGQLGLGSDEAFITVAAPILSLHGTPITAIAAGGNHTLALDWQGNVWVWGDNHHGELGIGRQHVKRSTPVMVDFPLPKMHFTRIAAGALHSMVIDAGGNLWAFGYNGNGQLGIGTISSDVPKRVHFPEGTPRLVMIAGGGAHSLAVDEDGNAWAWGFNLRGQLGIGTVTDSHAPARVIYPDGNAHPIVSIAAGTRHSLALESLPVFN